MAELPPGSYAEQGKGTGGTRDCQPDNTNMRTSPRLPIACLAAVVLVAQSAALRGQQIQIYFPPAAGEWETVDPEQAGWSAEALDDIVEFAGERQTSALLILQHGRVLAEHYWDIGDPPLRPGISYRSTFVGATAAGRPVEDVASVQKTVVSALAGIAVARGLVDVDAPVGRYLGEGWSNATVDQESRILVRHLLSMSSGLGESLEYDVDPDTRWSYNTPAYSRLLRVLEVASGLDANQLTGQWLTSRIGATDTRWVPRQRGPNTRGLAASARDLGRFGLLLLAGGKWKGAEVVPPVWLHASASASQPMNPSYGRLVWLNNGAAWEDWDHEGLQAGRFVPSAPADLLIARGVGDRRIYVLPGRGLVVVRLGAAARIEDGVADLKHLDRGLWDLIMTALKAG